MSVSKKAFRLIVIYFTAAVLTLGGFIYLQYLSTQKYEREIRRNYAHAFAELSASMEKISSASYKVRYSVSPSMTAALCAEIYSEAAAAQMMLGEIPDSSIDLEHTAAFLAKAGDYSFYMMKKAVSGNARTDEEQNNLIYFSEGAKTIAEETSYLQSAFLSGEMNISSLNKAKHVLGNNIDTIDPSGVSSGFENLENEFAEMPTLIYDGPFSDSDNVSESSLLQNESKISEHDAIKIAADFIDVGEEILDIDYTVEGNIPTYVISGEEHVFEITKFGGYVITYDTHREINSESISENEAVNIASEFLSTHGYEQMETTYWQKTDKEVIVNFAWSNNGIKYYPDLVKVSVSLDNGDITGFDAKNYISSHNHRDLPSPALTGQEASLSVSEHLTIESVSQAVIPSAGGNEVYCYEFKCTDENGGTCLVYVNASTGIEEKILILIEDENGTLTI